MREPRRLAIAIASLFFHAPTAWAVDLNPIPYDTGATELIEPPPADARIDIYAKCDGVTDDTAAFISAIQRSNAMGVGGHRVGVIRKGTAQAPAVCLLSDVLMAPGDQGILRWRTGPQPGKPDGIWQYGWSFVGNCRDCTILRLKDNQPKFQDRTQPKSIVFTASQWIGSTDPIAFNVNGEGARGFDNFLRDLTLDCGLGNDGCVGADLVMNNVGGLRNVRIIGNSGYAGIRFERYGPGPAQLANVRVEGFDYGLRIKHLDYGITLSRTEFVGQRIEGIHNESNSLALYLHRSTNAVPGLVNATPEGHVVSIDSRWDGGTAGTAAIVSNGYLMTRWLQGGGQYTGYATLVEGQTLPANTPEYFSHEVQSAFAADQRRSLRLPIKSPEPPFYTSNQKRWARASAYGADTGGLDDADNLQDLMNSRQEIAMLDAGSFSLDKTVTIPAHKRTIQGLQTIINPNTPLVNSVAMRVLSPPPGVAPTQLTIRGVHFGAGALEQKNDVVLEIQPGRKVYLEDCTVGRIRVLPGAELYLQDVLAVLEMGPGSHVHAIQHNTEAHAGPFIDNDGGVYVGIGVKMENVQVTAEEIGDIWTRTRNGGCTEILGGLAFTLHEPEQGAPVHIVEDASFFGAWTESIRTNPPPPIEMREMRGGITQYILGRMVEGLAGPILPPRGSTPGRQAFVSAHAGACPLP